MTLQKDKHDGGALADLVVLDLTRILSGPFATMTLADLGADVIKIEQPGQGDDTRQWGPPFQGEEAAYFLSVNRNKRSLAVDLKSAEGLAAVRKLALTADVLVENFRPGTAARLGLGYEELSARNPGLVYASISGYGQTGPDAHRPGYDAIAQARSGIMSVTGEAAGPPVRVGVSSADLTAGMWATIGILAALHEKGRTGLGQWVDISLLDGSVSWLTYVSSGYFASGNIPQRYGSAHPTIVPYQAFETADGFAMVAVGNDGLWRRFAQAVGRADLATDPLFAGNPDRVAHRGALLPLIEGIMLTRTTEEWVAVLDAAGVPVGPIQTVDQALADPQVLARGMVATVQHPTEGELNMVNCPIKLSRTPATVRTAPPLLGQHTDGILASLGLTGDRISSLRKAGAIQ
ncbi:formyl-CoA transferase/CoA:oxalate CoA-transferase [Arthrobacter silviterrae]|uniref:CaiB/BaiF CoA transferase family protein n=1 Tax=Arthrobacter TaxID=1663 RepID=UPI0021CD6412|nr:MULTISPECIES: CaiB/BaiF CoA-transferase family protein [Arthrobacter]MCU6482538.1 CoA transferase [Arthrobacter sp. A2-55]MDQ0276676.1 formyl-CoA transferase/CoA:oxalate CoA-transferase [Arthrobacter silviterrae]